MVGTGPPKDREDRGTRALLIRKVSVRGWAGVGRGLGGGWVGVGRGLGGGWAEVGRQGCCGGLVARVET